MTRRKPIARIYDCHVSEVSYKGRSTGRTKDRLMIVLSPYVAILKAISPVFCSLAYCLNSVK